MNKLDPKQKTQFIFLSALAVLAFGVFAFRMIRPTPAAAGSVAQAKSSAPTRVAAAGGGAAEPGGTDAPPPSADMRDPFVPGIADPAALEAYQAAQKSAAPPAPVKPSPPERVSETNGTSAVSVPSVPPLPGPQDGGDSVPTVRETTAATQPLPVAPVSPNWTVTGVLHSGEEQVAILRNGEQRRIVRTGDLVDSQFRIAQVTREGVVLQHGAALFTLPLGGGSKTAAATGR